MGDFAKHVQLVKAKKNEVVFYQGEVSHSWFFIFKGTCSIYVYTPDKSSNSEPEQVQNVQLVHSKQGSARSHRKRKRKKQAQQLQNTEAPAAFVFRKDLLQHTKGKVAHLHKAIEPLPDFVSIFIV